MTTHTTSPVSRILGAAMTAAAACAVLLHPKAVAVAQQPSLAQLVPQRFGEWREIPAGPVQVDPANVDPAKAAGHEPDTDRPYDDVLMRAYANAHGDVVLLALAYGRNQRQEIKIHRPEVCYRAQGFELLSQSHVVLQASDAKGRRIPGTRLLMKAPGRLEAVTYWIRVGSFFPDGAWSMRYHIFQEGLKGRALDGMLVRASRIVGRTGFTTVQDFDLQERFLGDLLRAMAPPARQLLAG